MELGGGAPGPGQPDVEHGGLHLLPRAGEGGRSPGGRLGPFLPLGVGGEGLGWVMSPLRESGGVGLYHFLGGWAVPCLP